MCWWIGVAWQTFMHTLLHTHSHTRRFRFGYSMLWYDMVWYGIILYICYGVYRIAIHIWLPCHFSYMYMCMCMCMHMYICACVWSFFMCALRFYLFVRKVYEFLTLCYLSSRASNIKIIRKPYKLCRNKWLWKHITMLCRG